MLYDVSKLIYKFCITRSDQIFVYKLDLLYSFTLFFFLSLCFILFLVLFCFFVFVLFFFFLFIYLFFNFFHTLQTLCKKTKNFSAHCENTKSTLQASSKFRHATRTNN